MSITVTDEQARRLRVRAQRLDPEFSTAPDVSQVVKEVAGLQAQDMSAATLGVRVRSTGSVAADVHRARIEDRSVVRTWCMRNTLHLVAADDLAWMMPVFQPAFLPANRRRRAQLGLDDETLTRGVAGLVGLLASNGPQTRSEIVAGLAPHGIYLAGQAAPHLIAYAALAGKVCQGPDRGREPTYVRLEDWLTPPKAVSRETALGELARRYLAAYGPARPEDLAAWCGLPMADVRASWTAIASERAEVTLGGRAAWMPKSNLQRIDEASRRAGAVRLLPAFDTYLLGYKNRESVVPREHAKRVNAGGGILHPVLLVDGAARGTWRTTRRARRVGITIEPFERIPAALEARIQAEVRDIGRFLGTEAALRKAEAQ